MQNNSSVPEHEHNILDLKCFTWFLGIVGTLTTIGLYCCAIPICRQIWRRKDTAEISQGPFFMALLSGLFGFSYTWLEYCKGDEKAKGYAAGVCVNVIQIVLFTLFNAFYWVMSRKKLFVTLKIALLLAIFSILLCLVLIFDKKVAEAQKSLAECQKSVAEDQWVAGNVTEIIGWISTALNMADFASPLAGLSVVIQSGETSTLPLPLCIGKLFVAAEWFIYYLLIRDKKYIIPNGVGTVLAIIQLILFVLLPRQKGQLAPIRLFYNKLWHFWMCLRWKVEPFEEDNKSVLSKPSVVIAVIDRTAGNNKEMMVPMPMSDKGRMPRTNDYI